MTDKSDALPTSAPLSPAEAFADAARHGDRLWQKVGQQLDELEEAMECLSLFCHQKDGALAGAGARYEKKRNIDRLQEKTLRLLEQLDNAIGPNVMPEDTAARRDMLWRHWRRLDAAVEIPAIVLINIHLHNYICDHEKNISSLIKMFHGIIPCPDGIETRVNIMRATMDGNSKDIAKKLTVMTSRAAEKFLKSTPLSPAVVDWRIGRLQRAETLFQNLSGLWREDGLVTDKEFFEVVRAWADGHKGLDVALPELGAAGMLWTVNAQAGLENTGAAATGTPGPAP